MNIAVICAPQTFGCNTGMFSVDLAAWYILHKHFPSATVRFFTLYPHRCELDNAPLVYESRAAFYGWEQQCDRILYWGDFLHSFSYRSAVSSWLMKLEPDFDGTEAQELIRHFLFRNGDDDSVLQKVILYGGTVLFNRWSDYSDEHYAGDLSRLWQGARAVWMREPFSASAVQYWKKNYHQSFQGTDCALLLDRTALSSLAPDKIPVARPSDKKRIGVFMGRSHLDIAQVSSFLSELAQKYEGNCSWLDWGRPPFFFEKQKEYHKFLPELAAQPPAGEALSALTDLLSYDLLVSDVYHVCVNAWNLGIPALCLIDNKNPLSVNSGEASGRDKRVVFYWSYNLSPFLIYASELADVAVTRQRVNVLSEALDNCPALTLAFNALQQHALASEGQLLSALTD